MRCCLIPLGLCVSVIAWPRSVPMRLVTTSGTLHGTLELPSGRGPFPVALIIAGSGPTDRNGNDESLGLDTDCYKLLARYLVQRGVASLRYDKRGAGDDVALALPEDRLRFESYVSDAVAWSERLRHDSRLATLTVVGHSEGSLIGMLAARRIPADGFVSIAGAGERASKLILTQLKANAPSGVYHSAQAIVAQLASGRTVAQIPPGLESLFRPSVQPYLISWFRYDPVREIAGLRMAVLIVQGERDLQVSATDARALYRADPAATLVLIPRMNHVMKDVGPATSENVRTYAEPNLPIDITLARSVGDFILHLTSQRVTPWKSPVEEPQS